MNNERMNKLTQILTKKWVTEIRVMWKDEIRPLFQMHPTSVQKKDGIFYFTRSGVSGPLAHFMFNEKEVGEGLAIHLDSVVFTLGDLNVHVKIHR